MKHICTSGILLRRIQYGDADLIVTFYSRDMGKFAAIAKSAKKSVKRFAGVLEPFSALDIVCRLPRSAGGMPVLQEATLLRAFCHIREDIQKMSYASYWAELVNDCMEDGSCNPRIYKLLILALDELDGGEVSPAVLSIFFQLHFTHLSGLSPGLACCRVCATETDRMPQKRVFFDLARGGLVCEKCAPQHGGRIFLSKGTIKELIWIQRREPGRGMDKVKRMRFTAQGLKEGVEFMETFAPYHLGKAPKSLSILRQIRGQCG